MKPRRTTLYTLSEEDFNTLMDFVYQDDKADTNQSTYPGMTYEQGMLAVLDVISGNSTVEDVT